MAWLRQLLLLIGLVGSDQLVKWATQTWLPLGRVKTIIPGVVALTNLHNDGAAWSILAGQQVFFIGLTLVAVVLLGYLLWRYWQQGWLRLSLTLILAGAVGNLIDRLAHGYVVDMFELQFINFPVFNVADICLTLSVGLMIYLVLTEKDEE